VCCLKAESRPTHACSAYDEYFKAYSVAVMGGKERPELLYGGKSESGDVNRCHHAFLPLGLDDPIWW
jgi:hypothetical protein